MTRSVSADDCYEIVKGDGPDGGFVELWDKSLSPGGLALEAIESGGATVILGHQVAVTLSAAELFLREAKDYLASA